MALRSSSANATLALSIAAALSISAAGVAVFRWLAVAHSGLVVDSCWNSFPEAFDNDQVKSSMRHWLGPGMVDSFALRHDERRGGDGRVTDRRVPQGRGRLLVGRGPRPIGWPSHRSIERWRDQSWSLVYS